MRLPVLLSFPTRRSSDLLGNQSVLDFHRITWGPGHLFDRTVLREPLTGGYQIACAVINRRHSRINAGRRPQFARRFEDVVVCRHVRDEVFEPTAIWPNLDGCIEAPRHLFEPLALPAKSTTGAIMIIWLARYGLRLDLARADISSHEARSLSVAVIHCGRAVAA